MSTSLFGDLVWVESLAPIGRIIGHGKLSTPQDVGVSHHEITPADDTKHYHLVDEIAARTRGQPALLSPCLAEETKAAAPAAPYGDTSETFQVCNASV